MSGKRKVEGRPSSKRRVRISLGAVVVLVLVLAGLGAYAYSKLSSARDDLNLATNDATALQTALAAGDQAGARTQLAQLKDHVRSAQSSLDSSVLSAGAKLPSLGKNITAARTVASAVRTVADDGLPPLVDVADKFNAKTFNPQGGKIDVAAIAKLAPNVAEAATAIDAANKRLQSVDTSSLLGRLQGPISDAQDKISSAASIANRARTATEVVPTMLEGKHTYLLVFQNNAEIRATGGLPGAYAELKVDDGKIVIGAQGAGSSIPEFPSPVIPITDEERNLFDTKLATFFIDSNFTPDFPRAAEIARAMYAREKGTKVDGVVSLDPVSLSYLLKGIGPIALEDGSTLTADNAIDVLLNGVYVNYPDPDAQDAFFASATRHIFDKVTSGDGDPNALLSALTRATNERRVAVWSTSEAVTKQLAGTALAHQLPIEKAASPALGFYLNDATGAKMQYYLDYSVKGKSTTCSADGVQTYRSEVTLHSSAPADSASLPKSIQGPGFGAEPGSMLMNIYFYAPTGGAIKTVTIDNEETTFTRGTQNGRAVVVLTVQLNPGQTVTAQTTTTSGKGQTGSTAVSSTPSIVPGPSVQTWTSSC